MIYSLGNTASQLDQAVQFAYSGLVVAGTGLMRITGNQRVSGNKTFAEAVVFESTVTNGSTVTHNGTLITNSTFTANGNASLNNLAVIKPNASGTIDVGTTSLRFKNSYFNNVDGNTGKFIQANITNLQATNLSLTNTVIGSNLTLSGTTTTQELSISGNAGISGNLTIKNTGFFTGLVVSGNSRITGSLSVGGEVKLTGNLNITGNTNLTGNLGITGNTNLNGNLNITGNTNLTGNINLTGNLNITGTVRHTGGFFAVSSVDKFYFKGINTSTSFNVEAPVNITGTTYIDGNVTIGNSKNLDVDGNVNINSDLNVDGNIRFGNIQLTGTVFASGTSSDAGLKLYSNATNTPKIGAIEFSRNSLLFSRQTGSAASRYSVPTIYHFFTKDEIAFSFVTGGLPYRFLGTTGILLDTGVYRIESSFYFRKGTTQPTIQFGFSGDNCKFTYINGYIGRIFNNTDIVKNFINTNIETGAFSGLWTGTTTTNRSGIADVTIVVTGHNHKIYPFLHSPTANATGNMTGSFSMTVTQLQTGTGLNNASFNGPWIA